MTTNSEKNANMVNLTESLAEYIDVTEYDLLPEKVVQQAKLCFLDFLSVTLRGSQTESAHIIRKIGETDTKCVETDTKCGETDTKYHSTIIGGGKSTTLNSALVNGVAAHSLDLDDGHRLAQLHPGACIIPAALALSESHQKSGKEFITAMVVGYQVAIQLGMILNPTHRMKGFHSTGTCGTLGAAAAASKISDLDKPGILNSLGLAGTQAAGLLESDHTGSMGKHLHAGKAAQSGVLSVLLANEGFTGAPTILEGNEGLIKAMSSPINLNKPMNKLKPEKYEILRVYFKQYPVCRHLHSSLDASIKIMNDNNLDFTDIQDILIETYDIAASHNNYQAKTVEGIRQSLPLSIAIALKEGNLTVEDISKISLDTNIINTSHKVKIKLDDDLNNLYPQKRPSKVTIRCKDKIYRKQVDLAKGEPENPLSKNELIFKFKTLNSHVKIGCLDILDELENKNMTYIMDKLNNGFKTQIET